MKNLNKKRGFTIVELTIVVSVIAILSAILIPTFAGIVKRSKMSVDEQAVRSINMALSSADIEEVDTDVELFAYLAENGIDFDNYVPMSKDHSFVWAKELKMVMLYSAKAEAIVYPEKYAGKSISGGFTTIVTDSKARPVAISDYASIGTFVRNGGIANFNSDIELPEGGYVYLYNVDATINVNSTITNPSNTGTQPVFYAYGKNTKLTLNGNGTVNANTAGTNDIAVMAWDSEVTINGGNYTNEGGTNELIYVYGKGKVIINGGTFKCAEPKGTLNCQDKKGGTIEVKGGKFWNYNPETANAKVAPAGYTEIILAKGYKVVAGEPDADGNVWYEVVAK